MLYPLSYEGEVSRIVPTPGLFGVIGQVELPDMRLGSTWAHHNEHPSAMVVSAVVALGAALLIAIGLPNREVEPEVDEEPELVVIG